MIACLSRFKASSTSSSRIKLKAALTYDVFLPFGRKTVPGSANTPRSNAFFRMTLSESPSPWPRPTFNLNLRGDTLRAHPCFNLMDKCLPVKHPSFRRLPFRETREMGLHATFKPVPFFLVELGHIGDMFLKAIISP